MEQAASTNAATLNIPILTVAVCGGVKKHTQSFDALKQYAAEHNAALRREVEDGQKNGRDGVGDNGNYGDDYDDGEQCVVSGRGRSLQKQRPRVLFRFYNLNYDPCAREMVLCTSDEVKGLTRPLPVEESNRLNSTRNTDAVAGVGLMTTTMTSTTTTDMEKEPTMEVEDVVVALQGQVPTACSSTATCVESEDERHRAEAAVNVVVHKVATFAAPHAAGALDQWCRRVRAARVALRSENRGGLSTWPQSVSPPLMLVDPLSAVEVLARRTTLFTRLQQPVVGAHGTSSAIVVVPPTFVCERLRDQETQEMGGNADANADVHGPPLRCVPLLGQSAANAKSSVAATSSSTFVCIPSSSATNTAASRLPCEERSRDATRGCGDARRRWWIAKPDESTGPAYTHHLVLWCDEEDSQNEKAEGEDEEAPEMPAHAVALLPSQAQTFIVQQFFRDAFPVVVKVYCIGHHVWVEVSPTAKLLALLDGSGGNNSDKKKKNSNENDNCEGAHRATATATAAAHTCRGAKTYGVEQAVWVDSQVKEYFPSSATPTPPLPRVSGTCKGVDVISPASCGSWVEHNQVPSLLQPALQERKVVDGAAAQIDKPLVGRSEKEFWASFFASGTVAHTNIARTVSAVAARCASAETHQTLSLFGVDVLLLPRHAASPRQQRHYPCGIGRRSESVHTTRSDEKEGEMQQIAHAPCNTQGELYIAETTHQPSEASLAFDPATGQPTALLLDAIPVVVDVNFFPGYRGIEEAQAYMLGMFADAYTLAANQHAVQH